MNHAYEGDRVMKNILALLYTLAHRNARHNDSPWLML
jgi:hypothetical protein